MSLHRFAALLRAEGHLAGRVMLNQLGVLSPAPDFLRLESWHVALSDDDSDACEIELAGVTSSLDATVLRLLGAHLVEPEVRLITLEVDEEPATACGHCDATTEDLRRLGWKASEDEDGVEVWTCPECRVKQPDELAHALGKALDAAASQPPGIGDRVWSWVDGVATKLVVSGFTGEDYLLGAPGSEDGYLTRTPDEVCWTNAELLRVSNRHQAADDAAEPF